MAEALVAVATLVLAAVGTGLLVALRRNGAIDRMMAVQLLGSGCIAVVSLLGVAAGDPAVIDVAMMLALLAAFAAISLTAWRSEASRDRSP
jgi:multicomponent Na+:H+ antiporter subunit F